MRVEETGGKGGDIVVNRGGEKGARVGAHPGSGVVGGGGREAGPGGFRPLAPLCR